MERRAAVLEAPEQRTKKKPAQKAVPKTSKPQVAHATKTKQPVQQPLSSTPAESTSHRDTTPKQQAYQPRRTAPHPITMQPPVVETPPTPRPQVTRAEALQILVARANAGNRYCLKGLRKLLETSPEIWQQVGDLARLSEIAWTDLIAGGDLLMLESVKKFVARLKGELAGPAPTAVQRLLVEQVVVTWLASRFAELAAAKPGASSLGEAKMRLKRAESAQKRYLASIKTLTELRAFCSKKM